MYLKEKLINPWGYVLVCAILALALSGCVFVPGQFQSTLDIRRDGTFTFRYSGEVVFALNEKPNDDSWDDGMAQCEHPETFEPRPCTEAEIATKREKFGKKLEIERMKDREAADDVAKLIGHHPTDHAANDRFAEMLMHYPGWKSARYVGDGIFDVEYEMISRLDRDFAFPHFPHAQVVFPFVKIAPNKQGEIEVSGAGLASEVLRTLLIGKLPVADLKDPSDYSLRSFLHRTKGSFAVTTDADVIESNGKKVPADSGQHFQWTIDPETREVPTLTLKMETKS